LPASDEFARDGHLLQRTPPLEGHAGDLPEARAHELRWNAKGVSPLVEALSVFWCSGYLGDDLQHLFTQPVGALALGVGDLQLRDDAVDHVVWVVACRCEPGVG
jgi:hypothetical protein